MKIEEQVTSLELSKKLKELRVKQESLFYWKTYETDQFATATHPKIINFKEEPGFSENSLYSAFTVAELGKLLPDAVETNNTNWTLTTEKAFAGSWTIRYGWDVTISGKADTEADARAKMLIYLIEHELMNKHAEQQTRMG